MGNINGATTMSRDTDMNMSIVKHVGIHMHRQCAINMAAGTRWNTDMPVFMNVTVCVIVRNE